AIGALRHVCLRLPAHVLLRVRNDGQLRHPRSPAHAGPPVRVRAVVAVSAVPQDRDEGRTGQAAGAPAAMTPAAAIAAHGLPSTHTLSLARIEAFHTLLGECASHRLLGLLACAIRDGAVKVTDEDRAAFEYQYRAWLTHSLRVERLLIDT